MLLCFLFYSPYFFLEGKKKEEELDKRFKFRIYILNYTFDFMKLLKLIVKEEKYTILVDQ